jgi:hypothetical protein
VRQVRILSRGESLLREPGTGNSNLAAAQGTWFELSPRRADERYELSMLGLTVAGPGVTSNLDGFGAAAGQLELAVHVHDGYSAVRDMAALTPETFGADGEWGRGAHTGTFADREAGGALDGSDRVGLRGMPAPISASPGPAQWTSPTLDVLYGTEIVATSWECWRLLDASSNTVAVPTIELLTGTRGGPGLINWAAAQTVASSAAEIERGHTDLAAPAAGDVYRWRITLPFVDPGVAIEAGQSTVHTATFFSLCAWIRLAEPRWRFRSAGELLERSEISRHVGTGEWRGGAEDVLLLRVPFSIALRDRLGEKVAARLTGGALRLLEIYPTVDLRFEEP